MTSHNYLWSTSVTAGTTMTDDSIWKSSHIFVQYTAVTIRFFYSPYLKEFEMVCTDKMGEVYGTYRGKKKCIQCCEGKT